MRPVIGRGHEGCVSDGVLVQFNWNAERFFFYLIKRFQTYM